MVERWTADPMVVGSIPIVHSVFILLLFSVDNGFDHIHHVMLKSAEVDENELTWSCISSFFLLSFIFILKISFKTSFKRVSVEYQCFIMKQHHQNKKKKKDKKNGPGGDRTRDSRISHYSISTMLYLLSYRTFSSLCSLSSSCLLFHFPTWKKNLIKDQNELLFGPTIIWYLWIILFWDTWIPQTIPSKFFDVVKVDGCQWLAILKSRLTNLCNWWWQYNTW